MQAFFGIVLTQFFVYQSKTSLASSMGRPVTGAIQVSPLCGCSFWAFPVTQNIITKVFLSCYLYSDPGSLNCGLKFGPFEIFGGKVSLFTLFTGLFTPVSNEIPLGMDIGLIVCLQDVLWDPLFLCCHLQQFLWFLSQAYRRPTKSRGVASY